MSLKPIYNANNEGTVYIIRMFLLPYTGLPMSTSSLSNNSLNSSSGTFNSNSSLNSTPTIDRYAALKDLDEQLREAKMSETTNNSTEQTNPSSKMPN